MLISLNWQLYVSAYTLFFGIPLLLAPDFALPLLGFESVAGPWARLAGMFLLSLSTISFGIYREKAVALVPYSIAVRGFIAAVLLSLAIAGQPPFLHVMALIVGLGVSGSAISLFVEKRERT